MDCTTTQGIEFVLKLDSLGFRLGNIIKESFNVSLRDYLKNLIPKSNYDENKDNKYFIYVLEALVQYLKGFKENRIDEICNHLLHFPVIQQADHSNLLFDLETFLNNYLFAIACKMNNVKMMITSQCSTVCCLSRRNPIVGPVFLRIVDDLFQVFPFSRRTLKDSNFCTLPGPVTMTFDHLEGSESLLKRNKLINSFVGRKFENATSCYRNCNKEIWDTIYPFIEIDRVALDESMTSYIAARHLLDKHSPFYKLIFDHELRDCFIAIKKEFVASSRNLAINQAAPDFFWFRKDHKLCPVVLSGKGSAAEFYLIEQNCRLPISYTPLDFYQALRTGKIYIDKIMAYLVRCLLPGITAIGGTSQQDYLRHYQEILFLTHQELPFIEGGDLSRICNMNLSKLGGAPLLELNTEQKKFTYHLDDDLNVNRFFESFLELPLSRTIGSLSCASYLISN